ncbi:MAG: universal stress protein [Pikeienuella sp.]
MFRKILVPVDLAEPQIAEKALTIAKRLAKMDGAEILLISVTPEPQTPTDEGMLEAQLQALVDREGEGLKMDGVLNIGGTVATEVRRAAEEFRCDLVVMASHWPRIDDYLFGSRSASVALHSTCSVLVVR